MTDSAAPSFLEGAFELPETAIPDLNYRMLHTALMHKLLDEAKHVPMTTAQYILIERIATTYIYIKYKESGGFDILNPMVQDKLNVYLLSLLAQFQKMLAKATSEQDREATFREVKDIITRVMSQSSSPAKREVLEELRTAFSNAGI
jgi:hypothetical protein